MDGLLARAAQLHARIFDSVRARSVVEGGAVPLRGMHGEELAELLAEEISHRLRLEAAIRDYLEDAPSAPFAAAAALLELLREDAGDRVADPSGEPAVRR